MSDIITVFDCEADGTFVRIIAQHFQSETLADEAAIDAKIEYLKRDLEAERQRAKLCLLRARKSMPF